MVKVSIEVHSGTARFVVGVQSHSVQRALSKVAARYPGNVSRVTFPIESESFFDSSAA
jgi:hypothetical protein